jgi:serine/threonine protein kinase
MYMQNNLGKVTPKSKLQSMPKLYELIQTEIIVLKKCKNSNVISYVDSFSSPTNVYILMEFCNGGDMEQYLEKKGGRLREDEALEFLKQILNGFKVCIIFDVGFT